MLIFLCVLAMSKFLVQWSALSRDVSRALGPRDPPRPPLSTSAQPPGQTFPFPFWSRRRNPRPARWKEGGARSSRGASHPPIAPSTATRRISHPSIQPPSPHLADTHGRAAAAAAGPSRLVSSLPDVQLLPCRFAIFVVLFPSHLLDLILLNLRKSSL